MTLAPQTITVIDTLPTADGDKLNRLYRLRTAGVRDRFYVVRKLSGGSFQWMEVGQDTPSFDLRDFGGVANPATDNRTAILAAITEVSAAGGGTVVGGGSYGFTGAIAFPSGVNVWGEGSGKTAYGTRFVCLNAAAQFKFGDLTSAGYGGLSGNFLIDGNNLATDPFSVGIVNGRQFADVFVANAAAGGAAMTVAGTQNSFFENINLETCAGNGLVWDRGAASNDITGLHIADCEGYAVKYVASGPAPPLIGIAYTTFNRIQGFIIEHQGASGGTGLIYHGVGSANTLSDGVISLAAVTAAKTIVTMALDDVTLPSSHLTLENVTWQGVQAHVTALSAGAGNSALLTGVHVWGPLLRQFFLAAGAIIHDHANHATNAVTSRFVANGGGITEDAAIRARVVSPLEIDRATAGDTAIAIKNAGVSKLVIDNNGVATWSGNTTLFRDSANVLRTDDGLLVHVSAVLGFLVERADGTDHFLVNTNAATGAVALPNGSVLFLYSDNYTTVKGQWDGATGALTTKGALTVTKTADGAFLVEQDGGTDVFLVNSNGIVAVPNGFDLILYSDAYVTPKFQVDGATGNTTIKGALDHDGTTVGVYGVAPVVRSAAYTPTNVTTDRAYDANVTTVDELADVLGTLIADLQLTGIIG